MLTDAEIEFAFKFLPLVFNKPMGIKFAIQLIDMDQKVKIKAYLSKK